MNLLINIKIKLIICIANMTEKPNYYRLFISVTYNSIIIFFNASSIYFMWIFLHFFASQLYIKFCVPYTFWGLITSPFLTASPHCQGLRWVLYNGANIINNMWIFIGSWICSYILIINKDNTSRP